MGKEGAGQWECIKTKPWLQDCFFHFKERSRIILKKGCLSKTEGENRNRGEHRTTERGTGEDRRDRIGDQGVTRQQGWAGDKEGQ